nr:12091_t:CDS:2 [Entrophospora candida]
MFLLFTYQYQLFFPKIKELQNGIGASGETSYKENIKLPVGPNSSSITITYTKSQNKQWFWVDEWQIDMSRPYMDSEGWQYARNFTKLDVN